MIVCWSVNLADEKRGNENNSPIFITFDKTQVAIKTKITAKFLQKSKGDTILTTDKMTKTYSRNTLSV